MSEALAKCSTHTSLAYSLNGRVLTVTLNSPGTRNALSSESEAELVQFIQLSASDPQFDVVILTGAGRVFSAGGDMNAMLKIAADPAQFMVHNPKRLIMGLLDYPKPIIAKINGDAIGLGATIALFCDVTFAAEHARIGDPHVLMGLCAGDGGAIIWPQLIGFARAREYLMTGELIPATQAAELGLINHAVAADLLDAAVEAFAQRLVNGALKAISATKLTVNLGLKQIVNSTLDAGLAHEHLTMYSQDHREAVHAFIEKRKPSFVGR
jgi:enoyl-CoA hydratase